MYDLSVPKKLRRVETEIHRVINLAGDVVLDGVTTTEDLQECIKIVHHAKELLQKFMFDAQSSWTVEDSALLEEIFLQEGKTRPFSEDSAVLRAMKELKKPESIIRLRIAYLKMHTFGIYDEWEG